MFRAAYSILVSRQDAEDIYQETFLALYDVMQHGKRFESPDHIKHWLLRVAYNKSINVKNSAHAKSNISVDPQTMGYLCDSSAESNTTFSDDAEQCLTKLSEEQRMLIYLRYYEGYSNKDIAEIFSIPATTVRTKLHRARKIIEQQLRICREDKVRSNKVYCPNNPEMNGMQNGTDNCASDDTSVTEPQQ